MLPYYPLAETSITPVKVARLTTQVTIYKETKDGGVYHFSTDAKMSLAETMKAIELSMGIKWR